MKVLNLLHETVPLLPVKQEPCCMEGRLKDLWRISRRYSDAAFNVSLVALNTLFLISKADSNVPEKVGEVCLLILSFIGILFIHYPLDLAWKCAQDVRFASKVGNYPIAGLALIKGANTVSNVALTVGSFTAAAAGTAGYTDEQAQIYQDMTLWGEIGIGVGLGVIGVSTLVNFYAQRMLKKNCEDEKFVATIRYCMDKDTLWRVIEAINDGDVAVAEKIVREDIDLQLKVALGGQILLVILGECLMAVEKKYPNSLTSAIINETVSVAYAGKLIVEKLLQCRLRSRLNSAPKTLVIA